MTPVSRGDFLKTLAGAVAGANAAAPAGETVLNTEQFAVTVKPGLGLEAGILHRPSGVELARGDYSYSFKAPRFAEAKRAGDRLTLKFEGDGLHLRHAFYVPANAPWFEEQITITNTSAHTLPMPQGRAGFVLPVEFSDGHAQGPLANFRFTAVPYRREIGGSPKDYADFTLMQVLTEPRHSNLRAVESVSQDHTVVLSDNYRTGVIRTSYQSYAAEGWCVTNGTQGFLITKYSQDGMEWSVLDAVPSSDGRLGLRWGGFGIFEGDPEFAAWLPASKSHTFGVTRVTAFRGGVDDGFYTFRAEMEKRGNGCPAGFNPPVHWNELYDNKLWWLPGGGQDDAENRKKYYSVPDLKIEAAKAREIGCEALYLDPGWDTSFASKIWDEARLGSQHDFVAMLRSDYGLSLSLHTPLAGWCNPSSYSPDMWRMERNGSRTKNSLCGASKQYREETAARLLKLAGNGAAYFMFDGTMFHGDCWDPNHGHALPAGREAHVRSWNNLARMVHAEYPNVLIEMHDQLLGGGRLRYVPTYYGHGASHSELDQPRAAGFDDIWAFELMWQPMEDLLSGRSMALYYYNLAYSIPLYLHIDLRTDNAQALIFWWTASTCRHLGIGGTHKDPAVQQAHHTAMANYRRLKPFFTAGAFYGIDEQTHVHRHPEKAEAVINCFNLETRPVKREVRFERMNFVAQVEIPALGHTLLEVK